ncbi:hypothetical protein EB796_018877 [Bugula neritina]|uniref:Uncharacterized protein n=1 Tax=Bugula neritina TaxID=10212 RepID=A0A7J7JA14_BUGNE|nr:hypothetical protein EB796_018877 [Bugula neritina]
MTAKLSCDVSPSRATGNPKASVVYFLNVIEIRALSCQLGSLGRCQRNDSVLLHKLLDSVKTSSWCWSNLHRNVLSSGVSTMQTGQLSASTSIDNSSFVSGGSKQAAPIKTAIIRPTNFYDGNRRLSFGASPGSKVKLRPKVDQQTGYSSPVNCSSDMSPLTPGADSDPLSDNGAVMYGTNATCRRRSKVEAWMEMSSPTLTDNSFEDSGSVNRQAYKRQAMKLSATSTLSREDIELSFENLCQELLALSASCTNLEGTIGKAESESGNAAFKRPTLASTNGEIAEAANKQLAVDISDRHCVSTSLLISSADAKEMGVTESGSRQNLKSIQEYEDMKAQRITVLLQQVNK